MCHIHDMFGMHGFDGGQFQLVSNNSVISDFELRHGRVHANSNTRIGA